MWGWTETALVTAGSVGSSLFAEQQTSSYHPLLCQLFVARFCCGWLAQICPFSISPCQLSPQPKPKISCALTLLSDYTCPARVYWQYAGLGGPRIWCKFQFIPLTLFSKSHLKPQHGDPIDSHQRAIQAIKWLERNSELEYNFNRDPVCKCSEGIKFSSHLHTNANVHGHPEVKQP